MFSAQHPQWSLPGNWRCLWDPTWTNLITLHLNTEAHEGKVTALRSFSDWHVCMYANVLSHVPLCDPLDSSLPGSSIHEISQARILEWVAISSSRGSFPLRDWTHLSYVSCIADAFFTYWAIKEASGWQRNPSLYNVKICSLISVESIEYASRPSSGK